MKKRNREKQILFIDPGFSPDSQAAAHFDDMLNGALAGEEECEICGFELLEECDCDVTTRDGKDSHE